MSLPALEKLQEKKLKALIQHAYDKVDYYRKLFDEIGLKPEDIRTLGDLSKIPITTRAQLQALSKDEIVATGVNLSKCYKSCTGGSSGRRLVVFNTKNELELRKFFNFLVYSENGYRITDRFFFIIHRPDEKLSRIVYPKYLYYAKIIKPLFRYFIKYVSIFDSPENWLEELIKFKPNVIEGYTSSIKELALEIKKRKVKRITPKIVFCTAELLSPKDKEFISSVFQAEVIDYYAANECGVIAWECREHKGYHIQSDNVIVEFIKEDGSKALNGEEGEVVITNLNSYTMPFIRYKLGDIGVASYESCPCGRGFPLMKIIAGRVDDYIILPNGKAISPYTLVAVARKLELEIARFQVIQTQKEKIKINIVKGERFSFETIIKLKNNCRKMLGDYIEIEPVIVNEIPKDNTRKFKTIISEIPRRSVS